MAWFWTDDLARALIEGEVVAREAVQEWLSRPVAIAAPESLDRLEFAQMLLAGERAGVA